MQKKSLLLSLFTGFLSLNAAAYTNTYVGASVAIQDTIAYPSVYRAWLPGVFIGYGGEFEKDYYLAGELAFQYPATISNTYVNRNDSMRMVPIVSVSFLPGMMLTPRSLIFLRVGLAEGRLPAPDTWRFGAIGGVGLEITFMPCWSVRSEYDYSIYRHVDVGNPRSDEFSLSLKYIFDV